MLSWIRKKPGKTSPALGSLPNGKPITLYHRLSENSRELEAFPDVSGISKPVRQLIGKPPETTSFSCRWRRPATCDFANDGQAASDDSLVVAAGGLRAKGQLRFRTGVFGSIEFAGPSATPFGAKNENSTPWVKVSF